MANFISRKVASVIGAGQGVSAATNLAEELRTIPWLTQLALEGKVYIAGYGLEETTTDDVADTLDETTPLFMLMAPSSGTIIVPIQAKFSLTAEGGGIPAAYLGYVGVDRVTTTTYTAMEKLQICGAATSSAALCGLTVSAVPAITDPQNVLLERRANLLDNMTSVEAVTTLPNIQTWDRDPLSMEVNFIDRYSGSLLLYKGTSIMFWAETTTSVSDYICEFVWAELPSSVYDHTT